MEHTHIVQASDLSRYADRRDSEGVIPELVYHLVRQSVPNATDCRIPYGDAINQPGMDGFVECSAGYPPFIPEGISYWEIGTGRNPQRKAAADFKKRTSEFSDEERAASSFIFVTPRSGGASGWEEPEQRKMEKKQGESGME